MYLDKYETSSLGRREYYYFRNGAKALLLFNGNIQETRQGAHHIPLSRLTPATKPN